MIKYLIPHNVGSSFITRTNINPSNSFFPLLLFSAFSSHSNATATVPFSSHSNATAVTVPFRRIVMRPLLCLCAFVSLCLLYPKSSVCSIDFINESDKITLSDYPFNFEYNIKQGTWNLYNKSLQPFATQTPNITQIPIIKNAYTFWDITLGNTKKEFSSYQKDSYKQVENFTFFDSIGEGKALLITQNIKGHPFLLTTRFNFYKDKNFMTISAGIKNLGEKELKISNINPLKIGQDNNGVFLWGKSPEKVWLLENGYKYLFDFWVRLIPATADSSISNWNTAIYDAETSKTFIAGFLTMQHGTVQIRINKIDAASSSFSKNSDLTSLSNGYQTLVAENAAFNFTGNVNYSPSKPIPEGQDFWAEILYLSFLDDTALNGLENYATAIKEYNEIKLWQGEIPTGWNVWATKYHTDINEEIILKNAEYVAKNLKTYGMHHFQIDAGWQITEGDWDANSKFPSGMNWIAAKIRELGLIPGVWIAPFVAKSNSQFVKDHPDWIVSKSSIGEITMPKDWEIIDISHPQVQDWLHNLFHKIGHEWGFKVLKTDFVYFALLGKNYYDKTLTNVEIYRKGLKIIRESLPEDAFIINVGVPLGLSLGYVNGMRLALDNIPDWGDKEGYGTQGLKPLVKNLARRYYLNYALWINHPDMFYLGSKEEETKRWGMHLTAEEAKTYATLVALIGGITKIGNTFTDLILEQVDFLRKLYPVYKASARPIDLFKMEYPQIWDLPIKNDNFSYHVVGVFNWGKNKKYGNIIEEATQQIEIDFSEISLIDSEYLAFEFWEQKFLGKFKQKLTLELQSRTVKVLSLHKIAASPQPQFLSTNRHISQGGTDIKNIRWDEKELSLLITQTCDREFSYSLTFYVPENFATVGAYFTSAPSKPLDFLFEKNILKVNFKGKNYLLDSAVEQLNIKFKKI